MVEWVAVNRYAGSALQWTVDPVERRRQHWTAVPVLLLFAVLCVSLQFIEPPPMPVRAEVEKLPPRLAKMVLEQAKPKPEPPKPEPRPEPKPEPEPQQTPQAQTKSESRQQKPPPSTKQIQAARDKATKSGLLALRGSLAAMRDQAPAAVFKSLSSTADDGRVKKTQRDLIGRKVLAGSGGVADNSVTKRGGGELASRGDTTRVGVPEAVAGAGADLEGPGGVLQRTSEEIQLAFDRNKAAIYAIYRRALRQNVGLQGRVVLALTIDPSGALSDCEIVSSELGDAALERKLLARIRMIDFGAKDVEVWQGKYHIDFFPSS